MNIKTYRARRHGTQIGLIALLMSGVATGAMAQTTDEKIAALEAKIAELSAQIADLKTSTATQINDVRTQAGATAPALSNGRPTIATADGQQKFAIRALAQFDAASYDEIGPGTTDLSSGTNFRRARLGIEGTFAKDWNYALTAEYGGSGAEAPVLNQAYVEYAGFRPFGLVNPLRLRLGAYATPTGLEDATSNTEGLFLERGAAAELVRNLAGGDGRSSIGAFANGDHWYASGVLTGGIVGESNFDEQYGYLARVAFNPFYSPDYSVHLGANVQSILQPADTAAGAATTTQVQLRERPELRVDGTRLVDTGLINSDGLIAYGLELGGQYRNFYVAGEAFKIDVDRIGAYDPSFSGWYVQGAWTITGETHAWNAANGGYRGIRPAKIFDPSRGDWGAWELAARYSVLDLNDNEGVAGSAAPAGGIRGGEQKITTAGLNWYPNTVIRFLLDYQWVRVDRLNSAGVEIGQDANVVSLRSQFAF